MSDSVQAVVQSIHLDGPHGPYAFALTDGPKTKKLTFSLEDPVWKEPDYPKEGMYVVLSQLRKKRAGWQAHHARYLTLADEEAMRTNASNSHSKE